MMTETIDKLYLELSRVTKAKTAREIRLEKKLSDAVRRLETIRETNPEIALDADIAALRETLSENADVQASP